MLSKDVGIKYSNEAEVLAILEALRFFTHSFQGNLMVESDLLNAISRVKNGIIKPWKLHF